jgi:hypothetical protein
LSAAIPRLRVEDIAFNDKMTATAAMKAMHARYIIMIKEDFGFQYCPMVLFKTGMAMRTPYIYP